MSTLDDDASEREEQHRAWAMKYRKHEGPAPMGLCHNCEASVPHGYAFCDADCREDYFKRVRR